jgi:hypothetical protein
VVVCHRDWHEWRQKSSILGDKAYANKLEGSAIQGKRKNGGIPYAAFTERTLRSG